jgi:hypothetical protein
MTITGWVTFCYVIEWAELGRVLKKGTFQVGIIQAVGKGKAV